MRRAAIMATVAAALGAHAAPANATTLEGTCRLTGVLAFRPPLANDLRDVEFRDTAQGTCSGTLDGVPQSDVPVTLRARGGGTASCLAGHTTSAGTLMFPGGRKLRFWTDTTGGLTQYASRFGGVIVGEGIAEVSVLARSDQSTLDACSAGTLRSAAYDLVTQTITPVVG